MSQHFTEKTVCRMKSQSSVSWSYDLWLLRGVNECSIMFVFGCQKTVGSVGVFAMAQYLQVWHCCNHWGYRLCCGLKIIPIITALCSPVIHFSARFNWQQSSLWPLYRISLRHTIRWNRLCHCWLNGTIGPWATQKPINHGWMRF